MLEFWYSISKCGFSRMPQLVKDLLRFSGQHQVVLIWIDRYMNWVYWNLQVSLNNIILLNNEWTDNWPRLLQDNISNVWCWNCVEASLRVVQPLFCETCQVLFIVDQFFSATFIYRSWHRVIQISRFLEPNAVPFTQVFYESVDFGPLFFPYFFQMIVIQP